MMMMFVKGVYYEHLDIIFSFRYTEKRLVNLYIIPETLERTPRHAFRGFYQTRVAIVKHFSEFRLFFFFKDILHTVYFYPVRS